MILNDNDGLPTDKSARARVHIGREEESFYNLLTGVLAAGSAIDLGSSRTPSINPSAASRRRAFYTEGKVQRYISRRGKVPEGSPLHRSSTTLIDARVTTTDERKSHYDTRAVLRPYLYVAGRAGIPPRLSCRINARGHDEKSRC